MRKFIRFADRTTKWTRLLFFRRKKNGKKAHPSTFFSMCAVCEKMRSVSTKWCGMLCSIFFPRFYAGSSLLCFFFFEKKNSKEKMRSTGKKSEKMHKEKKSLLSDLHHTMLWMWTQRKRYLLSKREYTFCIHSNMCKINQK